MKQEIFKRRVYFLSGGILLFVFCLFWMGVHFHTTWLTAIDDFGNQILRSSITDFNTLLFSNMTRFGDYAVVAALACITTLVLFYFKQKITAIWFISTMAIGGGAIPYILKEIIKRARPTFGLMERAGYSFPSGHATGASVFYGLLVVLAFLYLKKAWQKYCVLFIAGFLIVMIMWSRVYLGVHFPSDVLASLSLGIGQILCSTSLYLSYQSAKSKKYTNGPVYLKRAS